MPITTRTVSEGSGTKPVRKRPPVSFIAVSLAVVLGLAACSNGGHSASPTTASSTTATTASTDASHPTTTVLGPSSPPADYPAAQADPPSLAGAYPTGTTVNLVTVLKTLTTYRDWTYSHPNPASVKNYMFATGNEYTSEVQNLATLQRQGWHEDPTPTVIQWVKVTAPPKVATQGGKPASVDGHVLFVGGALTVIEVLTTAPYLNASNQVVGHEPGGGPVAYSITLAQESDGTAPDGQFRILDVTQLNPPGGVKSLEAQS